MHPTKGIKTVSHVDDFLCSGPQRALADLRKQLKAKYVVGGDVLGLDAGEAPEGKSLGRGIRFMPRGLEWEANKKQVESLLSECGLESGNCADTPGVKNELEEEREPMNKKPRDSDVWQQRLITYPKTVSTLRSPARSFRN